MNTLSSMLKRCDRCRNTLSFPHQNLFGREQPTFLLNIRRSCISFYSTPSLTAVHNTSLKPKRVEKHGSLGWCTMKSSNHLSIHPQVSCLSYYYQTGSNAQRQQCGSARANNITEYTNNYHHSICSRRPTENFYSKIRLCATVAAGKSEPTNSDEQNKSRWSNWTGKNSWKSGLLFMGLTFGGIGISLICTYGEPTRDQDGEIIKDAFIDKPLPLAYTLRAWHAVKDFFQMVQAPTSEKLLPDPLVAPYVQPPYTLVLELSGLLLKPEWDMKMGWRFKKRPGLDYFLQTCAQSGYEVVIFTLEPASVGYPLTVSMDPQGIIWYRLFKEDTRYTSGVHIKDLGCLNRDLAKVILLDVNNNTFQMNPRNGIAVRKWNGAENDRELYDLAAFLQTVASNKVEDIRTVIQHYNQFDDPMAKFRENQAAVLKAHEEMMKLQEEEKKAQVTKSPFLASRRR